MNKEEIEESKKCLEETIQNCYAELKAIKLNNLRKYIQQLENKVKELEANRQAVIELLETQITEDNIICKYDNLTLFFNKMKIEEIKKEIAKILNQYRVKILSIFEGEKK